MPQQTTQAVARLLAEGRRRIQTVADLGCVDTEETDPPNRGHVDRVAVENRIHENRVGASDARRLSERGSYCNGDRSEETQNLHTHLQLAQDRATVKMRLAKHQPSALLNGLL
jgi:hypothetical protein